MDWVLHKNLMVLFFFFGFWGGAKKCDSARKFDSRGGETKQPRWRELLPADQEAGLKAPGSTSLFFCCLKLHFDCRAAGSGCPTPSIFIGNPKGLGPGKLLGFVLGRFISWPTGSRRNMARCARSSEILCVTSAMSNERGGSFNNVRTR